MIIYLFIHFIFGMLAYMRINTDNHSIGAHTHYLEILVCLILSYGIFIPAIVIYFNDDRSQAKLFKLIRS